MNFFRDIFSADNPTSSMRVVMFMLVINAIIVGYVCIFRDKSLVETAALVGAFLGPALLGKAVQSIAEHKNNGDN